MTLISAKENLKREIGVRSLTFAIINMTVGAGIFVLPALVAENLGASAIISYFVCGVLIFLIALCFAEVGSRFASTGGTYSYIETAFGPYAGFIANNLFWFGSCVVSDAAISNALADTLANYFPVLHKDIFRILFFLFLFGSLALINIRSVKYGIRFIEFTAIGKLIPLILLIIAGTGFISTENLKWNTMPEIENIGATSLLLFYAFIGLETPVTNSGEMKNPKRTIPFGIFLGISCVLILYIAIQMVTQGVLGSTISVHKDSPLAAVAGIVFGKSGITLLIVATVISMLGCLGGSITGNSRMPYAGARDGLMPKVLSRVHPKFFTPHVSIVTYTSLGFLFAVSGTFRQLAIISSGAMLLIYLGVAFAAIKLRLNDSAISEKSFRIHGGITVPVLAAISIIWLLSNLKWQELIGIMVFLWAFTLIFIAGKLMRKYNLTHK